jgi:hypothetical protein
MKIRKEYLEQFPYCEVCRKHELAIRFACDIHHKMGTLGELYFDVKYFLAVCRTHHSFLHANVTWAKENGFTLDRY